MDVSTAIEVAKMKCAEKGIDPTRAEERVREEPEGFKSGKVIQKLVAMEYVSQIGEGRRGSTANSK